MDRARYLALCSGNGLMGRSYCSVTAINACPVRDNLWVEKQQPFITSLRYVLCSCPLRQSLGVSDTPRDHKKNVRQVDSKMQQTARVLFECFYNLDEFLGL